MELPSLVTVVVATPVVALVVLVYLALRPEPNRPICPKCHTVGSTRRKYWWSSAVLVCASPNHASPIEFLSAGEKIKQEGGSP